MTDLTGVRYNVKVLSVAVACREKRSGSYIGYPASMSVSDTMSLSESKRALMQALKECGMSFEVRFAR